MTVTYLTSKRGVVVMTKAFADALGPDGIRVNSVCPGMTDTELLRTPPEWPRPPKASDNARRAVPSPHQRSALTHPGLLVLSHRADRLLAKGKLSLGRSKINPALSHYRLCH
jgi:NAD(P)-dependent dehydrogenase (short-subunit alcohol dehydrogenase family)